MQKSKYALQKKIFLKSSKKLKPKIHISFLGGGFGHMACKELRSKKYISDGECTSYKPIIEVVCSGVCLPISALYLQSGESERYSSMWTDEMFWRTQEFSWRCVEGVVRKRKINLLCQNGDKRVYTVKVVK